MFFQFLEVVTEVVVRSSESPLSTFFVYLHSAYGFVIAVIKDRFVNSSEVVVIIALPIFRRVLRITGKFASDRSRAASATASSRLVIGARQAINRLLRSTISQLIAVRAVLY